MHIIEDWVLTIADSWWVHLVLFACSAIDGIFPTVPSESLVVMLSSLWSSSGSPAIIAVALAAWSGAFLGDNVAFAIGRKVGWERFRFLQHGKGLAAVQAAGRGLERRALVYLMTARYIPFGRTAVNVSAGAVRYPWQRFWPRSLLATFVWAVFSCTIGVLAGAWFENNHILAVVVGLVVAVTVSLIVERLVRWANRILDARFDRRAAQVQPQHLDGPVTDLAEGDTGQEAGDEDIDRQGTGHDARKAESTP